MKTANRKRTLALLTVAPLLGFTCTGCLVAGYSSSGGAFLWPGGFGLLLIVLFVAFLLRRR